MTAKNIVKLKLYGYCIKANNMMERNIYERLNSRVALNQLSRRTYMTPQVMSVVSHEPIMAAAGSNPKGSTGGDVKTSKEQDFFLPEDAGEN